MKKSEQKSKEAKDLKETKSETPEQKLTLEDYLKKPDSVEKVLPNETKERRIGSYQLAKESERRGKNKPKIEEELVVESKKPVVISREPEESESEEQNEDYQEFEVVDEKEDEESLGYQDSGDVLGRIASGVFKPLSESGEKPFKEEKVSKEDNKEKPESMKVNIKEESSEESLEKPKKVTKESKPNIKIEKVKQNSLIEELADEEVKDLSLVDSSKLIVESENEKRLDSRHSSRSSQSKQASREYRKEENFFESTRTKDQLLKNNEKGPKEKKKQKIDDSSKDSKLKANLDVDEKQVKPEKTYNYIQSENIEINGSHSTEKKLLKDQLKVGQLTDPKLSNPNDTKTPKQLIDSSSEPQNLQTITDSIKETFDQKSSHLSAELVIKSKKKSSMIKSSFTQTEIIGENEKLKTLQKIIKTQAKELESLRKTLSSKTSEIQSLNQKVTSLKVKKKTLKNQLSSKPCASHEADLNLKDKQIHDLKQKIENLSVRPTEIFHKKNNFSESEFWKLDDDVDKFDGLTLKEIAKNKVLWIIKAEEKKTLNPLPDKHLTIPIKSSLKHKFVRRSLEPLTPKFSSNT